MATSTRLAAFDVIGIALKADNTDPQVGEKIGGLWQRFFADGIADRIPGRVDDAFVALYTDYEGDHTKPYTVMVGCRVKHDASTPDGMAKVHVPAQAYEVSSAEGAIPDAVIAAWQRIWGSDLKRRFSTDFELYDQRAQDPAHAVVDIHIAVEA